MTLNVAFQIHVAENGPRGRLTTARVPRHLIWRSYGKVKIML